MLSGVTWSEWRKHPVQLRTSHHRQASLYGGKTGPWVETTFFSPCIFKVCSCKIKISVDIFVYFDLRSFLFVFIYSVYFLFHSLILALFKYLKSYFHHIFHTSPHKDRCMSVCVSALLSHWLWYRTRSLSLIGHHDRMLMCTVTPTLWHHSPDFLPSRHGQTEACVGAGVGRDVTFTCADPAGFLIRPSKDVLQSSCLQLHKQLIKQEVPAASCSGSSSLDMAACGTSRFGFWWVPSWRSCCCCCWSSLIHLLVRRNRKMMFPRTTLALESDASGSCTWRSCEEKVRQNLENSNATFLKHLFS